MNAIKYDSGIAKNQIFQKKLRTKYENQVEVKVNNLKSQLQFVENLVREMEEKLKIEQRKKAVLKNQCD